MSDGPGFVHNLMQRGASGNLVLVSPKMLVLAGASVLGTACMHKLFLADASGGGVHRGRLLVRASEFMVREGCGVVRERKQEVSTLEYPRIPLSGLSRAFLGTYAFNSRL